MIFARNITRTFVRNSTYLALSGALCFVLASACSATESSELENTGSGSGASSGTNSGGSGGFGVGVGGNNSGGACAGTSITAQEVPLDMYIMLDRSSSMSGNSWNSTISALTGFVNDPASSGIGVGLQFFPDGNVQCPLTCATNTDCGVCGPCMLIGQIGICTGGGGSCDANSYATPDVPIQVLPGVSGAIVTSMSNHDPTGNDTPTHPALDGAIQYAQGYASMNPNHAVVVVLATDGDPTGSCDNSLSSINALAAAGVTGSPSILTFVIGVGSSLTNLNGIAAAGGTGQAFLVDTNQNVQQQFQQALDDIRGQALGCEYAIPQPTMGDPDFNTVNVEYSPGNGGDPIVIPKVNSPAECPADGFAWYYDDNNTPNRILLCAGACGTVSADDMGTIDIVLGCATQIL